MHLFYICCSSDLLCKNEYAKAHDLKSGMLLQVDRLVGSVFSGQKAVGDLARQMVQAIINRRLPLAFKYTEKNPLDDDQQRRLKEVCIKQIMDHWNLYPLGEEEMKVCSWQEACRS